MNYFLFAIVFTNYLFPEIFYYQLFLPIVNIFRLVSYQLFLINWLFLPIVNTLSLAYLLIVFTNNFQSLINFHQLFIFFNWLVFNCFHQLFSYFRILILLIISQLFSLILQCKLILYYLVIPSFPHSPIIYLIIIYQLFTNCFFIIIILYSRACRVVPALIVMCTGRNKYFSVAFLQYAGIAT